jgi:glycosyltransferase involved in cell wall biosynthesis
MFTFMGFHIEQDGYGVGTIAIVRMLRTLMQDLHVVDMALDGKHGTVHDRSWQVPGTAVALAVPDWYADIHCDRLIAYTMFEADRLPESWVAAINACAACLVPSAWCREVFLENGVSVPITVAPWGVDPDAYWFIDRASVSLANAEARPYTFLWSGTPDLRKGWDVAYRAFRFAFGDRADVQLLMHFREALPGNPRFTDPNVRALVTKLDLYQWRSLLTHADCFVFPSRGEGWGLPPREAAATGLPTIVTDYGGLQEGIDDWAMPLAVKGRSVAAYGWWDAGTIGEWAEPDVDCLVELMRRCVDQPEAAREFGWQASVWLLEHQTWINAAQAILRVAT